MSEEYIDVELPDGRIVEFPASMAHEEIISAIEKMFPAKKPKKGLAGIAEDIQESGKNILPELWGALKQIPEEVKGINLNPQRIPQNILAGLAQGGAGILNTPANIRDYLANKELISQESPSFRLPESILPRDYDYAKGVGLNEPMPGDAFTQGLAAAAPYIAGGELGTLGAGARMATRSAAQVPFAIGQNQNPITAAAMIPALEIPLHGAAGAANAMRPSVMFRGKLTPQELMNNLRAAEGTQTALGDIIGSPTLKQIFENVTTKWPGSGADELLGNMAGQVENRAQSLLNESGEGLPTGDRNRILKSGIENAYEEQRKIKNQLYEPVNQLAQAEGFQLDMPTFRSRVNEQLSNIENSPLLQFDNDFRGQYRKLAGLSHGSEGSPSILEANMVADKLYNEGNNLLNRATNATDRQIGQLYLDLARRARADVKNQLNNASPELRNAYQQATNNYRENYSQFLDKDVYKWTRPDTEAQTIVNDIIQPGKQGDKYSRIEKIQNVLPENMRGVLGDAWLRQAVNKEGNINPKQLSQMIDKIGPRQFEALFPNPEFRQSLIDYTKLRGMNEKALSRMANPLTGHALAVPGMIAGQVSGVMGALGHGNIPLAAALAVGPQIGSNLINKALTSPAIRESLVQKMILNDLKKTKNKMFSSLIAGQKPFMETEHNEIY